MGFSQFADVQKIKTIDTNETVKLGKFSWDLDSQLRYAKIIFYLHNFSITTEKFRINIYPKYGHANPIHQSDWASLSNITDTIAADWIGWVRFDFSDVFIDSDHDYYLELEQANYTRNADTAYIGVALDYPIDKNETTNVPHNIPVGVEFYDFG